MAFESGPQLLDLARVQLLRLKEGDIEDFLAEEQAYAHACTLFAENVAAVDDRLVRELIVMTTAISAELERLMGDASLRMAQLQARRRAAGAYMSSPEPAAVSRRDI